MVKYFMSRLIHFHEPEASENTAVEPRKLTSLAGCYNYSGNELAQYSVK